MTVPAVSIPEFMGKLMSQLDNVLNEFDGAPASAVKLKAQTLIICEQLATVSAQSKTVLVALAIRANQQVSPLTRHSFICGLLVSRFAQQFSFHTNYTNELVSAALNMRIGLELNKQQLSNVIYQRKKLNDSQRKHYNQYPLHSANYLHKAKVISSNAIFATLQHQELLDGSGYPKRLKGNAISHSGQLLSLVNKLVELITPRDKRAPFNLSQSLAYLARRPNLYNPDLVSQLAHCLTPPVPGLAINTDINQIGLIEAVDVLESSLQVNCIDFINESWQCSGQRKTLSYNSALETFALPSGVPNTLLNDALHEQELLRIDDDCNSMARLKPSATLNQLLSSLSSPAPDQEAISHQINQLPTLGDSLINKLTQLYPNRQFNSSLHALQMLGFNQSRQLLSILALRQQLNHYQFPALALLESMVDTLLATATLVSEFTPNVTPNQLGMFVLLNIAPLYVDKRIHHCPERITVDINQINPLQPAGLFGLTANIRHLKIMSSLAKFWETNAKTKQLLAHDSDLSTTQSPHHHELVYGFQLALMLTQRLYHGLSFEHPSVNVQLKATCRKLKISGGKLKALMQASLTSSANCPLTSCQPR